MDYALIGCGRIAMNHIKAATENGLSIIAVCDIVEKNMATLLEKQGLSSNAAISRYTDFRRMLQEKRPQLVAIATESGAHAEIALECIAQGIPVIIEKPMAMNMKDAKEIIRLSNEKMVLVSVCHQNRFNQAVQEMRQALERGRFGSLSHGTVHVRWNRNESYYDQAPWRGTWAQDGGALMNQCIHGIDLLRWMMGDKIETVYGTTRQRFHHYLEAEDVGLAVIQFESGAIATIEGTTNAFPQNLEETLYLFGQTGTVKLGGKSCNAVDIWQFADGTSEDEARQGFTENVVNVYGNGHTCLYRDVIDALNTGRAPYIDAQAGCRALELVLAIYKSQKTGKPVTLPLEDFGTLEMMGTFDDSE